MEDVNRLFVLRHAKSSWDDPGLDDHERPLAPRGRRATELLSRYVRSHGIAPALVLCSSARRTRETLEGVAPGGRVEIDGELYEADAEHILERLRRVPGDTPSVMVIGHNPALQMLVLRVARNGRIDDTGDGDSSDLADVERKFPTGALATLELDCGWSELGPGRGRLTSFVRPRDLRA